MRARTLEQLPPIKIQNKILQRTRECPRAFSKLARDTWVMLNLNRSSRVCFWRRGRPKSSSRLPTKRICPRFLYHFTQRPAKLSRWYYTSGSIECASSLLKASREWIRSFLRCFLSSKTVPGHQRIRIRTGREPSTGYKVRSKGH